MIQVLMGRRDLRIKEVRTQYTISKVISHSACLDVLAEDENGHLYNIEIQNADTLDHVRRTRFYQAMSDSEFLAKGTDYVNLPELYIFYISLTDILKQKKTVYHMEKYWRETGQIVEDGVHIVFVNAQMDDGSEIAKLMEYFKRSDPDDMSQGALSERVRKLKNEEGAKVMCEYSEKLIAFGREEGREEGKREVGRNLLAMGMPLEQISQIVNESVETVMHWFYNEEKNLAERGIS